MRAIRLPRLAGFYILMAAVALAALWGGDTKIIPELGSLAAWGWAVGGGLGAGLGVVLLTRVLMVVAPWARALADEFRSLFADMSRRDVAVAALLSGVGEELLFRGVLQPALGLWIAAAVFGVLHVGPNRRFVPWTLMAFGAGILFGALFAFTGSLLAPMLAHVLVNYLNLRHLSYASGLQRMTIPRLQEAR